jgi:hypothetical protein
MYSTQTPSAGDTFALSFAAASDKFTSRFKDQFSETTAGKSKLPVAARMEICAALWAAIRSVFDNSALDQLSRTRHLLKLKQHMIPFWLDHCACDGDVGLLIIERSAPYLLLADSGNFIGTANAIVAALMKSAGTRDTPHPLAHRMLCAMLVHRMYTDMRRIEVFATGGPLEH